MKPAILIEASTVLMFVLAGLSLLVLAVLERQEEGPSRRSALMAMGAVVSFGTGLAAFLRAPL